MKYPGAHLLLLGAIFLGRLPAGYAQASTPSAPTAAVRRADTFTTRLIASPQRTHGYEVLRNGRVLISQPGIPGRAGYVGFRTPAAARRVAALVVAKLRAHEMPPTVTADELRQLHAEQ